ncbi:MAG TPA: VOC family protein [Caulobacteraceae bacterium]|jgi:catechol 2,3-dioxygenase-like lactoylglutathione lyase family enzyme|nr:VOC family protein [Caulobacteraceae bacterium]
MSEATLCGISPFFIVGEVARSLAFYCDRLGFAETWRDPKDNPFTAIIRRDRAQLFIKSERGIAPVPNATRHPHLRWDAFIHVEIPDGLAAEFVARGAQFSKPLQDTSDGLRGFEVTDPDGYVLFFGRPL